MKTFNIVSLALVGVLSGSCDTNNDEPNNDVKAPATYAFERNGSSTVSYSGQSTRIAMGEEFVSALKEETLTSAQLQGMFAHEEGNNDFSDASLNTSNKSIRSKTAASYDYYNTNSADAAAIKSDFDGWINAQVDEDFTNWNTIAVEGQAGNIQELGGSTRYVSAKGLEYNQAINKGSNWSFDGGSNAKQLL